MAGFGLVIRFRARDGCGPELEQVLRDADAVLRAADGCLLHLVARAGEDPADFWVTEVFSDRAAHAAALADPEMQRLAVALFELLDGEPLRVETEPVTAV